MMSCARIEGSAVSLSIPIVRLCSRSLGWWQAVIDNRMNAAVKTWNRPEYLTRFVTAAKRGHLLAIKSTLTVEKSSFWATELQHMPLIAIRQDFLHLAQTALHHAARKGFPEITRLLLEHGVNVEGRPQGPYSQSTALYWAAAEGGEATTKVLLDHGADVNSTMSCRGRTALHGAVGPRAYQINHTPETALHGVSNLQSQESLAVTILLLQYGAYVTTKALEGESALHRAVHNGYDKVIELLIAHGADLEGRYDQMTPLMIAAKQGRPCLTGLLLQHGADVHACISASGWTPLFIAVGGCVGIRAGQVDLTYSRRETIMKLLAYGAHINGENCANTPLAIATFSDSVAIVKLLLEQGADVDGPDRTGFTPLQLLCRYHTPGRVKRKLRMLDLLLEHGANPNRKTPRGDTPLTEVCWSSQHYSVLMKVCLLKMLLRKGANVNMAGIDNKTPLWIVCEQYGDSHQSRLALMSVLLDAKADVETTNHRGIPLLRSVCTEFFLDVEERVDVVRLLLKKTVSGHLSTIRHILINVPLLADSMARLLISHGALVDATDEKGETALHHAARSRNYKTFRALLACGADKGIRNREGLFAEMLFDII